VTYVAPGTGERMELSATSFLNAAAKAAGLLRDDLDVEPGDPVGVRLPLHWQRSVWWAACALVGAVYIPDSTETVTVVSREHLAQAASTDHVVLVSLAPFGLPDGGPIPAGVIEAATAARVHPDDFVPYEVPVDDWPLMPGLTAVEAMDRAEEICRRRAVPAGARVAVLPDDDDRDLLHLAVPLVAGGSVILINSDGHDIDDTLAAEGGTRYE